MEKISFYISLFVLTALSAAAATDITGELRQWHKVTLTFDGPEASEQSEPNPFVDYRLQVEFKHAGSGEVFSVPGYFAADGDAANTGAESGNKWRVHFAPNKTGTWNYTVSFRKGENVAVSDQKNPGEPAEFMNGETGNLVIAESFKTGRDMRAKGRLQYVGERYLRFEGNGEYFLKAGADAPENLFAYMDFDGDFKTDGHKDQWMKTWEPHIKDWKPGDPTWQGGKGKGLIGAINYLASKGMNVFSFLTLNITGDDQNVFPYTHYDERLRMDVSRLDQWEMVFEHGEKRGMFLHFKTQEAENQLLLDNGDTGVERKLYYRELIARFSHHLALNWNLGEENGSWHNIKGQSAEQRRAMAQYFYDNDPYHHHIVIHNGEWYDDLFGDQSKLTGASLQTNKPDFSRVYSQTRLLIKQSQEAGKPWAIACDEPGDAQHSLITDEEDPNHDNARKNALWGVFMAGGWGIEWYFGYKHPHSDLSCQDWRTRDKMWEQSRFALDFFKNYDIPFWTMRAQNERSHSDDWVLASEWDASPYYSVVYTKDGGDCVVDLPAGSFDYGWFNPQSGTGLTGLVNAGSVSGKKNTKLSAPNARDWVLLIGPKGQLNPKDMGLAPSTIELFSIYDFEFSKKPGYAPGYRDKKNKALAIDAAKYKDKFAAGETTFPGPSGKYDVVITTMTEIDGESSYVLIVNGRKIGEFQNPATQNDYAQAQHRWKNVTINNGDEILLSFSSHSNGKVPEDGAFAFSRGRWRSLAFVKPGAEYGPFVALDQQVEAPKQPDPDTSDFTFDFDPKSVKKAHEETNGLVVVEAENYAKQSNTNIRKWYKTTTSNTPDVQPDPDENHAAGASGGAYLEILPDTRKNHSQKLIRNENFTEAPGRIAVLYYPVYINTPGRYFVWGRVCPTGSEDNGLHVGLDGKWPFSGTRMQWISQNQEWHWDSKKRTEEVHTGVPYLIYLDIKDPGLHTIMFSMREDGFELDKWLMSTDKDVLNHHDKSLGPQESSLKSVN